MNPSLIILICGLGCSIFGTPLEGLAVKLKRIPQATAILRAHDAELYNIVRSKVDGRALIIVAHSRGGESAIHLARTLYDDGIVVDEIVLYDACGAVGLPPVPANVLVVVHYRPMISLCMIRMAMFGGLRPTENNHVTWFIVPERMASSHIGIAGLTKTHEEIIKDVVRIAGRRR